MLLISYYFSDGTVKPVISQTIPNIKLRDVTVYVDELRSTADATRELLHLYALNLNREDLDPYYRIPPKRTIGAWYVSPTKRVIRTECPVNIGKRGYTRRLP
jgi:hypothetical protein